MPTVAVNPPKTPVTQGSKGVAAATLPNVCKMPGPPAPFVPTPLPNIGKSDNSPQGYSTTVTIEGQPVAIKGATFNSIGDVASQGTGGGLISSNVQGPTSFVGPGSMDVKIEGKNVQLLGDPMLNNGGPSGSPSNAATMMGLLQAPEPGAAAGTADNPDDVCPKCGRKKHDAGKYPRSKSERKKALLRDAKDPGSELSDRARKFILASGGDNVPRGHEVSHETPLYTKPKGERCELDKAENMKTQQRSKHRARHRPGGDQYKMFPR